MEKNRNEISEGFHVWLKDRFPQDAEMIFYAYRKYMECLDAGGSASSGGCASKRVTGGHASKHDAGTYAFSHDVDALGSASSLYVDFNGNFGGWERHLPHIHQEGVIQFVTFRLGDSLPAIKLQELREEKAEFERLHPKPWDLATYNKYYKPRNKKVEYWLEQGYGECVLRKPEVRQLLIDAINFADNNTCLVLSYVIMPNHVHMLILPLPDEECVKIIGSIKQYSARIINKLLGRSGRLWFDEPFDRMLRNDNHLEYCLNYINRNPANLPDGDYALYFNNDLIEAIFNR